MFVRFGVRLGRLGTVYRRLLGQNVVFLLRLLIVFVGVGVQLGCLDTLYRRLLGQNAAFGREGS